MLTYVRVKRQSAPLSHVTAVHSGWKLASFVEGTQDYEEPSDYWMNYGKSDMRVKTVFEDNFQSGSKYKLNCCMVGATVSWHIQGETMPFGRVLCNSGVLHFIDDLQDLPRSRPARRDLAEEFLRAYNGYLRGDGYMIEITKQGEKVCIGPYLSLEDIVPEMHFLYVPIEAFSCGGARLSGTPETVGRFKDAMLAVKPKLEMHSGP